MRKKPVILPVFFVAVLLAGCSSKPDTTNTLMENQKIPKPGDDAFSLKPYLQEAAIKSSSNQEYLEAATYWYALHQENPSDLNIALQCASNMRFANSPGDAVNVISNTLKIHPGNVLLHAERGKAYAALGNIEMALEDINIASAASTADWSVHSAHGVILDRLGRHGEAEQAYKKALTLSPDNPKVLNNLALSLALTGRHDEAVATLQRAVQNPNANMQVRQNLSLLLAMKGDIKGAGQLSQADLPNAMAQNNMNYFAGLTQSAVE